MIKSFLNLDFPRFRNLSNSRGMNRENFGVLLKINNYFSAIKSFQKTGEESRKVWNIEIKLCATAVIEDSRGEAKNIGMGKWIRKYLKESDS